MDTTQRDRGEGDQVKLTIEVVWTPFLDMNEDPSEPMRHAHQAVRFAAEDLVERMKACQGLSSITKLSVEAR